MKNKYLFASFVVISIIAIAVLIVVRFATKTKALADILTTNKNFVSAQNVDGADTLEEYVDEITSKALQKYAYSSIQTVSVQDIAISVTNLQKVGNEIFVDVCYQFPDNSDWTINQATITTNDQQVLSLSGGFGLEFTQTLNDNQKQITTFNGNSIEVKDFVDTNDEPNYRCDKLDFLTNDSNDVDLSKVILNIESLIAIPREGQECKAYMDKVQVILDAKDSGIKINCTQVEGGPKIEISSKPDSLSIERAEQEVLAIELADIFSGPWEFEIIK